MSIDLNTDIGEGLPAAEDEALLDVVTSANVACGAHAGDPVTMDRTIASCAARGVALGAHPGYFDRDGFGRRAGRGGPAAVETEVLYQIGALLALARARGVVLKHVKPHGALYNQAAADRALADAVARAVARAGCDLMLVGLAGSTAMRGAAEASGLRFAAEAFADRRYTPDGALQARSIPGAVLSDPDQVLAQAISIARDGFARAADGSRLALRADTLCVHGDTPGAAALARAARAGLEAAGVRIAPLVA
jgi:5-oxoprolinase (ATP-hydrolysing) subunit A